ncbi:MAG: phosphatidylinositol kinase [Legionellales bacterium]|nr:phosphatidylinositol kinase [Legionellales bacterium]
MTSNESKETYVWIWLPGEITPVVAGRLIFSNGRYLFNYGKNYLARTDAISIYDRELPLQPGILNSGSDLIIPNAIRDAGPDAWGRRVIINKMLGKEALTSSHADLNELTYLLESGSDRIGALDFQRSADHYEPRGPDAATIEELQESASRVEQGIPLSPQLDMALAHGSSIGGARPKALIDSDHSKYIAKFSSTTDLYSIVKAEYIAMRLGKLVGLNIAEVSLTKASGKDVLLIQRFDRVRVNSHWQRRVLLSALTLLGLDEMMARYASYVDLAELIRQRFRSPQKTLMELFSRIVFNILVGNTDDHARNHAAFWDGQELELTPCYDICPQPRTGFEATQAMLIGDNNRESKLSTCVEAAHHYLLSPEEAKQIIASQIEIIAENWSVVCDSAELTETERNYFWRRQFFNPYAFEGATEFEP